MFARFDENPAMTLQVIKETKRYGRTDGRTHARTDNVKTVYPLQTKFAGGIKRILWFAAFVCLKCGFNFPVNSYGHSKCLVNLTTLFLSKLTLVNQYSVYIFSLATDNSPS